MSTTTKTDNRTNAWACGKFYGSMSAIFDAAAHEAPDAVQCLAALDAESKTPNRSDVWGTKAALASGLRGEAIEVRKDAVTVLAFVGPTR